MHITNGDADYFSYYGSFSETFKNMVVTVRNSVAHPSVQPTHVDKTHLKLSHLPSKQGIKGPYPRTPSSVSWYGDHWSSIL